MMLLRRYICLLLLLSLLVTQYGLARHAAIHFFEDGGAEATAITMKTGMAEDHGGAEDHDHHCDLCDFAKMLGHAAPLPLPPLLPPVLLALALLLLMPAGVQQLRQRPYAARASPAAR